MNILNFKLMAKINTFRENVNQFWTETPINNFTYTLMVTKLNKVNEFIEFDVFTNLKNQDKSKINVKAQNKICVLSDTAFENATYNQISIQSIDKQIILYYLRLNTLYYNAYVLKVYPGEKILNCVLVMLECYSALEELIQAPVTKYGLPLINKNTNEPVVSNAKDLLFSIQRYFFSMIIFLKVYPYQMEKLIEIQDIVVEHVDANIYYRLLKQKASRIIRSFDIYFEQKLRAELRTHRPGEPSKYIDDIRYTFSKKYNEYKRKNQDQEFIKLVNKYQEITIISANQE